jgi:hypothetical protein
LANAINFIKIKLGIGVKIVKMRQWRNSMDDRGSKVILFSQP